MPDDFYLANLCRETRERQGLSIAALAARARVSNRSIATVERTDEDGAGAETLAEELRTSSVRKKRAWARVLIRIATALGDSPETWLSWLQEVADFSFDPQETRDIARSAQVVTDDADLGDTWTYISDFLETQPESEYCQIPVAFLYSGALSAKGKASFYGRFVQRLFSTINPRLRPTGFDVFDSVRELIRALAAPTKDAPRLVVGLFDRVGRARHPVRFLPVPGWQIQLACLVEAGVPFKWQDVMLGPRSGYKMRALTVAHDAWDEFLRGSWDEDAIERGVILPYPKYDIGRIAAELDARFSKERSSPHLGTTVFVTDQLTAVEVQSALENIYGRRVVDLAAGGEPAVPRYQLSMAVRSNDDDWWTVLSNTIHRELFSTAGVLTAEVYANYIVSVLAMTLPTSGGGLAELPSYLQLRPFGSNKTGTFPGPGFIDSLKARLIEGTKGLLEKRPSRKDDQDLQDDAEILVKKILCQGTSPSLSKGL
jgi:transcriptional regulator with XRE-family HTH domain